MTRRFRVAIAFVFACALLPLTSAAQEQLPVLSPPVPAPPPPNTLRLNVACAENGFVMPYQGLTVTLDGQPLPALGVDTAEGVVGYTRHGWALWGAVATDVGFSAPTGRHRLVVTAPDCLPVTRDVELPGLPPLVLSGSLPPVPSLSGPVDAPNGWTLSVGGFFSMVPSSVRSGTSKPSFPATASPAFYAMTKSSIGGGILSLGYEHRHFVLVGDLAGGGGTYSAQTSLISGSSDSVTASGTSAMVMMNLRAGGRITLHSVAILAGSGLGVSAWFLASAAVPLAPGQSQAQTLQSDLNSVADVFVHVPIWVAVELKPTCNLGAEIGGSYNIGLNDFGGSFFLLSASLLWQPNDTCSRSNGLNVAQ